MESDRTLQDKNMRIKSLVDELDNVRKTVKSKDALLLSQGFPKPTKGSSYNETWRRESTSEVGATEESE